MVDSKQIPVLHVYAVDDADDTAHWLKMREIPLIGDTVIIMDEEYDRVFKVTERGQISGANKLASGWVRLTNVEDPNVAPGSDNYQFMKKFRKAKP